VGKKVVKDGVRKKVGATKKIPAKIEVKVAPPKSKGKKSPAPKKTRTALPTKRKEAAKTKELEKTEEERKSVGDSDEGDGIAERVKRRRRGSRMV
jgi:hypothetical protein